MSLAFRTIETGKFAAVVPPSSLGKPPKLEWLAIADLVIDPEYQREIGPKGRKNIAKIVSEFDWSKFAPIIVASSGSSKYAIVDGQHRATAAAICGLEKVPCAVIDAARAAQAAAFAAINTVVTEMSPLQIHAAKIAAGDKDALGLLKVCNTANVEILRYPVSVANMDKPGQTLAVNCLAKRLKMHGKSLLITALQCITETENNIQGNVNGIIVTALCDMLVRRPQWLESGEAILKAFDEIDIASEYENLRMQPVPRGSSRNQQFSAHLEKLVEVEMKPSPPIKKLKSA